MYVAKSLKYTNLLSMDVYICQQSCFHTLKFYGYKDWHNVVKHLLIYFFKKSINHVPVQSIVNVVHKSCFATICEYDVHSWMMLYFLGWILNKNFRRITFNDLAANWLMGQQRGSIPYLLIRLRFDLSFWCPCIHCVMSLICELCTLCVKVNGYMMS